MLEAVGFPVAVNPETRLAALARKRGWLVEHLAKAPGGRRPLAARSARAALAPTRRPRSARRTGPADEGAACSNASRPALRRRRRSPAGVVPGEGRARSGRCALRDVDEPRAAGPRTGSGSGPAWPASAAGPRAPSTASSSRYFEPIVSFPFTPGPRGRRRPRRRHRASCSIPSSRCAPAASTRCARACAGRRSSTAASASRSATSSPGCRRGSASDTGGGWSTALVAHESPAPRVPDDLSDEDAVIVEPTACAVHAAPSRRADRRRRRGHRRRHARPAHARRASHARRRPARSSPPPSIPHQRELAARARRRPCRRPGELARAVVRRSPDRCARSASSSPAASTVVIDCVGSDGSIAAGAAVVAPGGDVAPRRHARPRTASTSPALWHRESASAGALRLRTALSRLRPAGALDLASARRAADLGRLVSRHLSARSLPDAIEPRRQRRRAAGAVKIAFDTAATRRKRNR